MSALRVTDVRLIPARPRDRDTGLLGYVGLVLNGSLSLDGITLRRGRTGECYLAYPARTDCAGNRHPFVRPTDDRLRRDIERQVLELLDIPSQEQ